MDPLLDAQMQTALAGARQGSLDGAARPTANTPEAARAAAQDFESVFLAQMLEQMMGETSRSGFAEGPGQSAFKSMLNEEYAKVIAKAGGIGLAEPLAREMLALQEETTP